MLKKLPFVYHQIYEKKSSKFVRIITLCAQTISPLHPNIYKQNKKNRNLENRMIDEELSISWKWTVIK